MSTGTLSPRVILLAGGLVLGTEFVWWLGEKWYRYLASRRHVVRNEVYFFPDRQLSNFRKPPPGQERLVSLLEGVELQLELALYLFTCHKLASALLRALRRGVRVMMVTENQNIEAPGS